MRLLYTHHNSMLVGIVRGKLELEGIAVELRNDLTSGGAGELAPLDVWPELWISEHNEDCAKAEALVAEITQPPQEPEWKCRLCGEENSAAFEVCWRCMGIPPQAFE